MTMPASEIVGDKSEHCIPFILDRWKIRQERHAKDPDSPRIEWGPEGGEDVLGYRRPDPP